MVGLNATPLVAGDVVVVGAAHAATGNPQGTPSAIGYIRGFDARTGKRLWIFHTIPRKGEFGYETWLDGSAERNGNLGAWAQMSADLDLGLVYVPLEMPADDYYGVNRPGSDLFRRKPDGSGPEDRQAKVALSDRSPWTVGQGSAVCADALRHGPERPEDQGAGPAHKNGVSLRSESRDRCADLAHRRAAGAAVRRAGREDEPDTAISDQAGAFRPAGSFDG